MSAVLAPALGPSLLVRSDLARPMAPLEIQEAVQLWGRKSGRQARLVWTPAKRRIWHEGRWIWIDTGLECWCVELSLRPNDPTLRAWREGRLRQDSEPTETVLLIRWDSARQRYVPLDIEQLGASGVVRFLEQGDTWSGRGEFNSFTDAFQAAIRRYEDGVRRLREEARQWAIDVGRDVRRRTLKIPFLRVGIDLRRGGKT